MRLYKPNQTTSYQRKVARWVYKIFLVTTCFRTGCSFFPFLLECLGMEENEICMHQREHLNHSRCGLFSYVCLCICLVWPGAHRIHSDLWFRMYILFQQTSTVFSLVACIWISQKLILSYIWIIKQLTL